MFWATIVLAAMSLAAFTLNYLILRTYVDPHVIVYTKHDDDRPTILMIVIENIGKGIAYDVEFTLSRRIPHRAFRIPRTGQANEFDTMTVGPLITGIPVLAPGERRVIDWGQIGGLLDTVGRKPVSVSARYSGRGRLPWNPTDHVNHSVLEIFSFEHTNATRTPQAEQVQEVQKLRKSVERIERYWRGVAAAFRNPEMQAALDRVVARRKQAAESPRIDPAVAPERQARKTDEAKAADANS